jgi:hypothetical protein
MDASRKTRRPDVHAVSSVTECGKVATRPSAAIEPRSPADKTAPDVGDESLARRRTLPETTATVVVSPASLSIANTVPMSSTTARPTRTLNGFAGSCVTSK